MPQRRCCVCGAPIRWRDSLCHDCLTRYGDDRNRWPEWLVFLVNDTQREINTERRHREVRICDATIQCDDHYPSERCDAVNAAWRYIIEEMV